MIKIAAPQPGGLGTIVHELCKVGAGKKSALKERVSIDEEWIFFDAIRFIFKKRRRSGLVCQQCSE